MPSMGRRFFKQQADEDAIVFLTPLGHGLDGRMGRLSLPARIEVQAAREDEAVHVIEKRGNFRFLAERRHDDRQSPGRHHRFEVAGIETQMGAIDFAGRDEVGVDADHGPCLLGHVDPSLDYSVARSNPDRREATLRMCPENHKMIFVPLAAWLAE